MWARKGVKKTAVREEDELQVKGNFRPETKHNLLALFLLALSVILILSLANLAGVFGEWLYHLLAVLFGYLGWAVPFIILYWSIKYLKSRSGLEFHHWLGMFMVFFGLVASLYLIFNDNLSWQFARSGGAGGVIGYLVFTPLNNIMGLWASGIFLIALIVGGLLVFLQTTIKDLGKTLSFKNKINISTIEPEPYVESDEDDGDEESPLTVKNLSKLVPKAFRSNKQVATASVQEPLIKIRASRKKIEVPLELLKNSSSKPTSGNVEAHIETIQKTLADFGIEVEMGDISIGPTVTQYTLKPAQGVKLAQITGLSNDLALSLAAHPIRIEAPIPGKALVGIEVPNQSVATVSLKEILESEGFKQRKSNLTIALGKDVAGKSWVANIENMPHLLIAGSTGSGKSVCINSILISLLYINSPDDLKFIIVDPKRVELASYNDVPHLLTPVITEIDKTINALKWVVSEMDRRYQVLAAAGKRNIQSYRETGGDMPYIVVVIDELADLMAVAANDVEAAIIRLAQMARAVGIHLIVATQRPSVDVITGLIKANITNRIAFTVASAVDSRTILDTSGAEKLLGKGDCLYISPQLSKPKRLQGAFVSDEEIDRVVKYIAAQAKPEFNPAIVARQSGGRGVSGMSSDGDDLLEEAKAVVIRAGKASASLLQRRLRVGYARAARLMDLLEESGIVGPGDGAKPREVLVDQISWEQQMLDESVDSQEEVQVDEVQNDVNTDEEIAAEPVDQVTDSVESDPGQDEELVAEVDQEPDSK